MRDRLRGIVMTSLFTALTAVGAFIKIPIPHVPLTLQTLIVMFAGSFLGSRLGALSQILYVTIGLLGLPIFAQGGGPGYVLQPSFGFLVGFIAGAFLIGKIMEKGGNPSFPRTLSALVAGQLAIYLLGISYLYFNLNFIIHKPVSLSTALKIGLLVFIPGDIIKTIIATSVMVPVRKRLVPGIK
jgi:biotin transport system substrate-specific component